MTTVTSPYLKSFSVQTFDIEINPIKIGARRIMMLYFILLFPLLLASSIIYSYLNLPRYTFIAVVLGIATILLFIFFKVSKKYNQKATYHLTLHQNTITLFENHKAIRHIPFKDLTIETSFWGSSDALHPAILFKSNNRISNISIGTNHYAIHQGKNKNILDYTDFLIANKESWKQLIQTISKK